MNAEQYNAERERHKRRVGKPGAAELVTIQHAHAAGESDKALRCYFKDNSRHWIPKSMIAPASQVKRRGDRGSLVVAKWWATKAGVFHLIKPQTA